MRNYARFLICLLMVVMFVSQASAQETTSDSVDRIYRITQAAELTGLGVDMASTTYAMTHPLRPSTYQYCMDGTVTCSSPNSVTSYTNFNEGGPARIFGKQNTSMAVLSNTAFDVSALFGNRFIYKRGGRWRYVAIGVNITMAVVRFQAGIGNINRIRSVQNDIPAGAFNIHR